MGLILERGAARDISVVSAIVGVIMCRRVQDIRPVRGEKEGGQLRLKRSDLD